ncbi:hypothetical protein DFH27DRAFT_585689 [Peziza echinospora]|nr:hypothetical protein DFH27DRAFT_585689 [Peziza echinospora]
MRAAMLRERFPETVYAAYASSAPIQASENMTFYWDQVHRGMAEYGLANCTAHIFAALEYIDAQLALSPESAAAIKSRFLGRTGENTTHGAFADALLYPLYGWQSLGAGDPVLQEFCQVLETGEGGRDHRAPTAQVLADRWARWGLFAALVNAYNPGSYCEGFVTNNARTPSCRLGERFTSPAGIAWTWQYCTEWGFFQGTNLGPHALGSRFNTLAHQQALCYAQFPDGLASGHLPRSPRTEYVNALYGGWRMRPSNTFWTSGEWDPWRSLTPLSAEAFALGTPVTGEVPACGVRPRERLFGYTLENSEHCYDFDPAVNNPRAGVPQRMFARALHVWLGCFGVEPAEA